MAITLAITCDVEGCEEQHVWDPEELMAGSELIDHDERGGIFWIETGWTNPPEGWQITDGGERCPQHRTVLARSI